MRSAGCSVWQVDKGQLAVVTIALDVLVGRGRNSSLNAAVTWFYSLGCSRMEQERTYFAS